MQNKTSTESNFDFSEDIKDNNKNITCKDGYCFIPNLEDNKSISNENINIFEPL